MERRSISVGSKIRPMYSLVTCIFLYACDSWTVTADLQRRIQAVEIRCYRKILRISCKDHVTNVEVSAKMQQARPTKTPWSSQKDANGNGKDMSPVPTVWPKRSCKAQWKGEEDKADRRRGLKTPLGTGLEFAKSKRDLKNGDKRRKLVDNSSVVPKRPPR